MTTRVQIPAYTDRWMMGDRFGVVEKITRKRFHIDGDLDLFEMKDVAHVKLDKSGKTVRVLFADCEVLP